MSTPSPTFGSYLKIDELLSLQQPLSKGPEHDEMLFIVVHQVYELWFRQMLHEITQLQRELEGGAASSILAGFNRVLTIMKNLVGTIDIVETMTPISFNSFRDLLQTSSGFQSAQFRQFEFALGHKRPKMVEHFIEGSRERLALEAQLKAPTLWDAFLKFLARQGIAVPQDALERDVKLPVVSNENLQVALVAAYKARAESALTPIVSERMVDLDEGLQEWRYRHVKMVERTIGTKTGSGGSMGAEYLKQTLFKPLFPDLWEIRNSL